MAFVLKDRVKETSTTTSTGTYTLAGAASNFRAFSAVMANNDTTLYAAVDQLVAAGKSASAPGRPAARWPAPRSWPAATRARR